MIAWLNSWRVHHALCGPYLAAAIILVRGTAAGQPRSDKAQSSVSSRASVELRMMSYNIRETYPDRNADYDQYIARMARYIAEQRLDIVAIQEVPHTDRPRADVIGGLAAALDELGWPMDTRLAMGWAGNALLSRHRIRTYSGREFYPEWAPYRIWIQDALIDLPGGECIRVLNHHPHPLCGCSRDPACPYYWEGLRPHVDAIKDPNLFVLGDFNFGRGSECYADLTTVLRDACAESPDPSCRVTADPRIHPGIKEPAGVDYVFFRSDCWAVVRVVADHRMTASDHYPVIALFRKADNGPGAKGRPAPDPPR